MTLIPAAGPHLRTAATAFETFGKAYIFEELFREKKEGVVFKNLAAVYSPGRPNSGGNALKCKFVETASFIVEKVNAKRSVSLQLLHGGQRKPAGNVTVLPNYDLPTPGAVVECQYLHAFPESGSIYQPVYLGVRDDVPVEDCTVQQLKFKVSAQAEGGSATNA